MFSWSPCTLEKKIIEEVDGSTSSPGDVDDGFLLRVAQLLQGLLQTKPMRFNLHKKYLVFKIIFAHCST